MSAGGIAAIVAAAAFVVLVILLAALLHKVARTVDETTLAIRQVREGVVPLLNQTQQTVTQVNSQLEQLDGITKGVASITQNTAAVTSLVSATVSSPLVKIAAFSYGVRSAVRKRQDAQAVAEARQARRRSRRHARGKSDA